MRGVMSSPDAGISMLRNKIDKREDTSAQNTDDESEQVYVFNEPLKDLLNADDVVPEALETTTSADKKEFNSFISNWSISNRPMRTKSEAGSRHCKVFS